jgi:hypothetical protein
MKPLAGEELSVVEEQRIHRQLTATYGYYLVLLKLERPNTLTYIS